MAEHFRCLLFGMYTYQGTSKAKQYHLKGWRSGGPSMAPKATTGAARGDDVDVLIVGSGLAGLTLAAQLAAFPDISTRIT